MTAGFFANAATLAPHGGGAEGPCFEPFEEGDAYASRASFRARPNCEFCLRRSDGREYMRDVTAIDPEWLSELAPHFYRHVNKREREPLDAAVVF